MDFVAASGDTRACVQVTENMTEPATMDASSSRFAPYATRTPKAVMAMRGGYPTEVDSIKILGAADFLLHRGRDCVNGRMPRDAKKARAPFGAQAFLASGIDSVLLLAKSPCGGPA